MTNPNAITITPAQMEERDRWERLLLEGKANLFDAMCGMLSTGAPATPYLLQRLTQAEIAYKSHDITDLAEAFGIAMGKREKNAMNRQTMVQNLRHVVDAMHARGFPKQDPSKYDKTAFHVAGEVLHKSPSQVFDLYYEK